MAIRDIHLKPVDASIALRDQVYEALRLAIVSMSLYTDDAQTKLDERRLAEDLGVSRTPIREALSRLEQEGLVRLIPRRGAFVVRKSKREMLQIICVLGALESFAARLVTVQACDEEISALRTFMVDPEHPNRVRPALDEQREVNIRFHRAVIRLSKCDLLSDIAEGLFVHIHAILDRRNQGPDRLTGPVVDHLHIIEALERRDAELAERLVREHNERLAEYVERDLRWAE